MLRSFPSGFDIAAVAQLRYYRNIGLKEVECEIKFDVTSQPELRLGTFAASASLDELLQLQPSLAYSRVRAVFQPESGGPSSTLSLALERSIEAAQVKRDRFQLGDDDPNIPERLFAYDVTKIDQVTEGEVLESKPDGKIIGASVRNFSPAQIGIRYDHALEQAHRLTEIIASEREYIRSVSRTLMDSVLPTTVVEYIKSVLEQNPIGITRSPTFLHRFESRPMRVGEVVDALRRWRAFFRARSFAWPFRSSEIQSRIEELLNEALPHRVVVETATSTPLSHASDFSRSYFLYAVRYLGPLRGEPKPIYPLEALANPTEVGYKGEHTAAVLDLHRDLPIEYIPSSFGSNNFHEQQRSIAPLQYAVIDWLSYLGVAKAVTTGDRGKIGHLLQVQTEGLTRFHDLTNVGVGVSQVLPIIVMALLAEPPCLLVFEQPELHLHPKVQARLADFFLSVALVGKQCILETHSEYLIERFRRRIAEAEGESLKQLIKIYFTERKDGATTCRSVDVSRYGAISDYPTDFFDQSLHETDRILMAATAKRAAEKLRGN